ncbi:MAG: hypothetical protein GF393_10315, partial [Armatimonadia bacterium]|nr:hypothetical protein [Armatimonadia bacterium]
MTAGPAESAGPEPLVIADFAAPEVLDQIVTSTGVSISLAGDGRDRALQVRVRPFSEHGNRWPYIFFTDAYFPEPIDLSVYSRVTATIRNVTEGLATVRVTMSSKPYNDGGRNLEGEGFVIPGGTTMQCDLSTSLFRRPMNDPSSIQGLMFVFPPNELNAVYRIDRIDAVYDPVEGSPADRLKADVDDVGGQIGSLEERVDWDAVPAERAAALRARIPELSEAVDQIRERAEAAGTGGWRGAYQENRDALDVIERRLGEFALADKTGFHLWHRPPYTYCYRNALPDFESSTVD